ncbi:hypothetical protein C8039_01990 [Halogeometricum sp. wsp3]|nr:hypothetical protein C8039_01990 [Halogeometricum sp. wsp3]
MAIVTKSHHSLFTGEHIRPASCLDVVAEDRLVFVAGSTVETRRRSYAVWVSRLESRWLAVRRAAGPTVAMTAIRGAAVTRQTAARPSPVTAGAGPSGPRRAPSK